jgi:preprotein translocase subunit SecG
METLVVVVHIIVAISIVGLVLLQQGKGADAGASFGSGASQTVFGASGSGNFLTRATTIAATVFFITSLSLAIFARDNAGFSTTTGLPQASPGLLPESAPVQSDVPQLDDIPIPQGAAGDIPAIPQDNGAN